jgi:hypothetical protein
VDATPHRQDGMSFEIPDMQLALVPYDGRLRPVRDIRVGDDIYVFYAVGETA